MKQKIFLSLILIPLHLLAMQSGGETPCAQDPDDTPVKTVSNPKTPRSTTFLVLVIKSACEREQVKPIKNSCKKPHTKRQFAKKSGQLSPKISKSKPQAESPRKEKNEKKAVNEYIHMPHKKPAEKEMYQSYQPKKYEDFPVDPSDTSTDDFFDEDFHKKCIKNQPASLI